MPNLVSIVARPQLEAMSKLAESLPPGDFAEVGVFHGGSAEVLYQITEAQRRELHLFDTFTGTPVYTEGLDHHKINEEFAAPMSATAIREYLPNAKLHIGIYPDTHPEDLGPLAFVHCDCDQYLSYIAVIDRLWPLVVPGGVILFDDYPYLAGAKKAVEERFTVRMLQKCHGRHYVVKSRG